MALQTPVGILSFPVLFSPKPRAQGGEPVYASSLIFDLSAQRDPKYEAMRQAVRDCIDEANGPGKSQDRAFLQGVRSPFRPTSEKQYKGYADCQGGVYINAWTKSRPGIVDARRNEILTPEDVWAGQGARFSVQPFWYNQAGNRGVSFALNNVQICRTDGPRLDGRANARDEFDDFGDPSDAMAAVDDAPFWLGLPGLTHVDRPV